MEPLPRNGEVIITIKDGIVQSWREVRHGQWVNIKISISDDGSAECSLCGAVVHNNFSSVVNYCPMCGASMMDDNAIQHTKCVGNALDALDEVEE